MLCTSNFAKLSILWVAPRTRSLCRASIPIIESLWLTPDLFSSARLNDWSEGLLSWRKIVSDVRHVQKIDRKPRCSQRADRGFFVLSIASHGDSGLARPLRLSRRGKGHSRASGCVVGYDRDLCVGLKAFLNAA